MKRALVVMIVAVMAIAGCSQSSSSGATATPQSDNVTVTYLLTGTASKADLTYTDSSGKTKQEFDVDVPLRNMGGTDGLSFPLAHGTKVTFTAEIADYDGTLDCTIQADGVVINQAHASGARYTKVTCTATLP